jgi:hypothetical protein
VPAPHRLAGDRDSQGRLGQYAEVGIVGFFLKLPYIFFVQVAREALTEQPDGLHLLQFCESSSC